MIYDHKTVQRNSSTPARSTSRRKLPANQEGVWFSMSHLRLQFTVKHQTAMESATLEKSPLNGCGAHRSRVPEPGFARWRGRARLASGIALLVVGVMASLESATAVEIRWALSSNRIYVTG